MNWCYGVCNNYCVAIILLSVVTVEDGVLKGGLGSAILEFMSDRGYTPSIRRIGIPDTFVQHGTPKELYQICGMDAESIEKVLLSF